MIRFILCAIFYGFALTAIYAGRRLAPDMTWPANGTEWIAADLLVMGSVAKLAGHYVLLLAKFR